MVNHRVKGIAYLNAKATEPIVELVEAKLIQDLYEDS